MTRILRLALPLAICVGLVVSATAAVASSHKRKLYRKGHAMQHSLPRAVRSEIVVQFRARTDPASRRAITERSGARIVRRIPRFDVSVVRARPGVDPDRLLRRYLGDPRVLYAEPNLPRPVFGALNDPNFADQWGLHNTGQAHPIADPPPTTLAGSADADIDAPEAWDTQTGNAVVAVLDTGVDLDHPDLDDNIWSNPGEIPSNGIDDDDNGFVDDTSGWDFKGDDPNPRPSSGIANAHGTHVAGIIAAEQNNGEGGSGVCPGCDIMPLRFGLDLAGELQGIAYAVNNGADVLNASFGGPIWSNIERSAIQQAGNDGLLVVAAASNDNADNDMFIATRRRILSPVFPATYNLPSILSVAASNDKDQYGYLSGCASADPRGFCQFTNWGHDSVDIAAPGVDVLSTVPMALGSYAVFNGTSMAAPMAAGVAALVESQAPSHTPVEVKNAVMNSVDHSQGLSELFLFGRGPFSGNFTRTSGRLNANSALTAPTTNATPRTDGNVDGARRLGRSARGRVSWPADVNDVYRKRLRRGHTYRITLDGPRRRDFDLYVWEPGTKEIWQLTAGCFGRGPCPIARLSAGRTADESVKFVARKSGNYMIQVLSFFSAGSYRLNARSIA
jgi:subtilisin family serine protease